MGRGFKSLPVSFPLSTNGDFCQGTAGLIFSGRKLDK